MKRALYVLSAMSVLTICAACAHYPDVRPGASEHKVTVSHKTEGEAFQYAMRQARDYCDDAQNKKTPTVISEQKKYTGSMDEKTYKNTQTVKGVASALAAFGSPKTQRQGQMIDSVDLGKPYQVTLVFNCK